MSKIYNLYSVFDVVSGSIVVSFHSANDGTAVRENYNALKRINANIDNDLRLMRTGSIDSESMAIVPQASPVVVSWNAYKFPESPVVQQMPIDNRKK